MARDGYASVVGCARCGQDHGAMPTVAFKRPIVDEDGVWTHWATCQVTGDPILMQKLFTADKERAVQAMAQSGEKL